MVAGWQASAAATVALWSNRFHPIDSLGHRSTAVPVRFTGHTQLTTLGIWRRHISCSFFLFASTLQTSNMHDSTELALNECSMSAQTSIANCLVQATWRTVWWLSRPDSDYIPIRRAALSFLLIKLAALKPNLFNY